MARCKTIAIVVTLVILAQSIYFVASSARWTGLTYVLNDENIVPASSNNVSINGTTYYGLNRDNIVPLSSKTFNGDEKKATGNEITANSTFTDGDKLIRASNGNNEEPPGDSLTTVTTGTIFKRYDGVVIATKVLWQEDLRRLKQWVCLLSHSYNYKMKYDIVVFTTLPWDKFHVKSLQQVALPANLTVVLEGPPLEEQLKRMSKEELQFLRRRCGVKDENEPLSWNHHCTEPGIHHTTNLGYSWQAEFRAYHIWTHPAIKDYKYMMWLDTDCRIGREWDKDPMKIMVDNDLTVLYAGFPYGDANNPIIKDKMVSTYQKSICRVDVNPRTHQRISPSFCGDHSNISLYPPAEEEFKLHMIAGNHHITNLDVFRKDIHQQFLKNFTGDYRFGRQFDDQLAVTIVGLMEQDMANRTVLWHERSHGLNLKISHHGMYDVERTERPPRGQYTFFDSIKDAWNGLEEKCGTYFSKKAS